MKWTENELDISKICHKVSAIISKICHKVSATQKIANALNITHTSVRRICNNANITLNTNRKLTDEMKKNLSLKFKNHKNENIKMCKEYDIKFPDGTVKKIKCLNEFCRIYNLKASSLRRVKSSHKGYKILRYY